MNNDNPSKGYFRVFRSIWNDVLIEPKREFTRLEAWWWLISTARSKKGIPEDVVIGNKVIKCSRGQVVRSLSQLMTTWRWKSKERVSGYLSLLVRLDRITTESLTVAHRISIVNYEHYQDWSRDVLTDERRILDDHKTDGEREENGERTRGDLYNTGESVIPGDSGVADNSIQLSPVSSKPTRKRVVIDENYSQMFLEWWKSYPRRGRARSGIDKSYPFWKSLDMDSKFKDVMQSLERWKDSQAWRKDGGEFIPGAHRWLKEGLWKELVDE